MGLSSKQVSIDGLDWEQTLLQAGALELPRPPKMRQQQQQQSTPLNCPRCDSTNTKFCYYNNYNKSQPRHFCKSCRRHWTKGGTLRNVPVGGGRKNKRIKTSKTTIQAQKHQNLALELDQKPNYQALLHQPSSLPLLLRPDCLQNSSSNNYNSFLNSTLPLPSISNLPFTSLISFDGEPASISAHYSEETKTVDVENPTMISTTNTFTIPPWQIATTSNFMDSASYWGWDDLITFVSTDLKQPWDDSQNKPQ